MAISLALFFAIQVSATHTGGILNPAIGLVQWFFMKVFKVGFLSMAAFRQVLMIFIVGPLLGGLFGGLLFKVLKMGNEAMGNDNKV